MSAMIDFDKLDDLARRLSSLVPPSLRDSREELQENFKSVLQSGLAKLDLVTREEFEVQRAVLLRTREKLDELQRTVADPGRLPALQSADVKLAIQGMKARSHNAGVKLERKLKDARARANALRFPPQSPGR